MKKVVPRKWTVVSMRQRKKVEHLYRAWRQKRQEFWSLLEDWFLAKSLNLMLGKSALAACSATWVLDTNSAFALGTRKTTGNFVRVGRSQNWRWFIGSNILTNAPRFMKQHFFCGSIPGFAHLSFWKEQRVDEDEYGAEEVLSTSRKTGLSVTLSTLTLQELTWERTRALPLLLVAILSKKCRFYWLHGHCPPTTVLNRKKICTAVSELQKTIFIVSLLITYCWQIWS
jgi:hypothetical protein